MHLRFDNGNGTSKDWIITQGSTHLTIQYGKTGSRLRQTVIPASTCRNGINAEMQRRIQEKLDKGYFSVQPNDPEVQKMAEKARKAREKKEAMEHMSKMAVSKGDAVPPTWF